MTVKERLHKLVDELSELEADDALRILIARHKRPKEPVEPDELPVPEAWRTFADGTPQPNWTAAVRRSRAAH